MFFRPNGDQPRLGKRINNDEKAAYHPDVDVFFQEVEWVENTFSKDEADKDRFVLLGIIW